MEDQWKRTMEDEMEAGVNGMMPLGMKRLCLGNRDGRAHHETLKQ